jgi:creatinine amidohydrolase
VVACWAAFLAATTNSVLTRLAQAGWVLLAALVAPSAGAATSVQLEDLTWPELRSRIGAGATTALVPVGGTEQNGPHMALGKHNVRVRVLATRIAQQLGQAIVTPVLAYVPEGAIDPPSQHMRWPGTLSISDAAFEGVLEGTAKSLRQHGFCHVVLLGDHGGYRASLERVATRVNAQWAKTSACRLHSLPEYYRASTVDHAKALQGQGVAAAEIGSHAGLADTSLMLAIEPGLVRRDLLATQTGGGARDNGGNGVNGDPARASADFGKAAVEHIVQTSVAAIRAAIKAAP